MIGAPTPLYTRARARVGSQLEHTFSLAEKVGKDLHYPPMEIVPLDTQEPMDDNSYLSDRAIFARDKDIERRLRKKPGTRMSLLEKYREALELIGGIPRLAIEADADPLRFMDQLIRLETAAQVKKVDHSIQVIQPAIPMTALDAPGVVDATFEEVKPSDGTKD